MAWAVVANTIAGDGGTSSSVTTSAIDTTGATLIVVGLMRDANNNQTVFTDSKSNTWNMIKYIQISGSIRVVLYYTRPTSVGSGHTFSNTGSFNFSSLGVIAFSGNAPEQIIDNSSANTSTSTTTVAPGSLTPSQDNCLVVTALGFNAAGSPVSVNDSFTETGEVDFNTGISYGGAMAYKIQTTAAAANPTWTRTNADGNASVMAVFKLSPEINTAWLKN